MIVIKYIAGWIIFVWLSIIFTLVFIRHSIMGDTEATWYEYFQLISAFFLTAVNGEMYRCFTEAKE